MTSMIKKQVLIAALALVALMSLGAAVASAHGGGRGKGGVGGAKVSTLVTRAATQLNVSRTNLVAAIRASAVARINQAVEDEDISSADAGELREAVADNLSYAYHLSRASTVASNLNITTTALNNGFRAARRAIIAARITEAIEDGDIDVEQATELREQLAEADLPGYKPTSLRGFGRGFGGGFRR